MNNYYNPMQSRVDSLMQQKAMIEQQLQSLQQMNVPNININNIPSNPTPSNFDFNGKWVDGEEQARNVANNNLPLILFDNNNPVFYMKNMDGAFKKFKFEEIKEEKVENTNNERMDMLEAKMDTILKALQGEPQQVQQNVPSEQKPPQNARKGAKQMANPLKSFMGGGTNPLGGMMNPQNMLMNMLKQRNPQMFSQINQMMNSGVNPNDFMKQMGVTPQQMEMAKQQAKKMFGNNIKF